MNSPVVVNLRQKGRPNQNEPLEIFHDRSNYNDDIRTIGVAGWRDAGSQSFNLVRYSWDSIKYYMQLTYDNTSPFGYIKAFIANDPSLLGEENTFGDSFFVAESEFQPVMDNTPPEIPPAKRDIFRYYRK